MFLGALLFASCFDSSCGAEGVGEVKAGAMMSICLISYIRQFKGLTKAQKSQSASGESG
jgi:hypothetical protein